MSFRLVWAQLIKKTKEKGRQGGKGKEGERGKEGGGKERGREGEGKGGWMPYSTERGRTKAEAALWPPVRGLGFPLHKWYLFGKRCQINYLKQNKRLGCHSLVGSLLSKTLVFRKKKKQKQEGRIGGWRGLHGRALAEPVQGSGLHPQLPDSTKSPGHLVPFASQGTGTQ